MIVKPDKARQMLREGTHSIYRETSHGRRHVVAITPDYDIVSVPAGGRSGYETTAQGHAGMKLEAVPMPERTGDPFAGLTEEDVAPWA